MALVVSGLVAGVGGEVRLRFMMMSGECWAYGGCVGVGEVGIPVSSPAWASVG